MKNNYSFYKGHETFVAKVRDLEKMSYHRYRPVMTSFLSPVEWSNIKDYLDKDTYCYISGGYANAQRRMACISPFEIEPDFDFDCLVSAYDARFKALQHSDVLGALMHLGIDRDFLGDFVLLEDHIYIFCKQSLSEFIQKECTQIGRCPVAFSICDGRDLHFDNYEEINVNCASLRLDAIVAALAHCSRSEAMKMIHQGLIKVNDVVLEQNSQLCNNDFVSIRRVGRFQFKEVCHQTRKQRLVLRFLQFK